MLRRPILVAPHRVSVLDRRREWRQRARRDEVLRHDAAQSLLQRDDDGGQRSGDGIERGIAEQRGSNHSCIPRRAASGQLTAVLPFWMPSWFVLESMRHGRKRRKRERARQREGKQRDETAV